MKGIKIATTGTVDIIKLSHPLYKSLQEVIGGHIEIVRPKGLPQPYCMIVDGEGLLKEKDFNPVGSYFYGTQNHGHPIVGDIVLCKETYTNEGLDLDCLLDDEVAALMKLLPKRGAAK